jgi:hypothetical protein
VHAPLPVQGASDCRRCSRSSIWLSPRLTVAGRGLCVSVGVRWKLSVRLQAGCRRSVAWCLAL